MKHTFVIPDFLRRGIAALLSVLLLTLLAVPAYADPTEEEPGPPSITEGTVHLVADVPDGFEGTVSIQLSNVDTGELVTVTAYASNSHEKYETLPVGTYFVERAFTSEDNFVYEALTEYFEFTLGTFQEFSVDVVYHESAQAYLDEQAAGEDSSVQPNEGTEDDASEPVETPDDDASDNAQNTEEEEDIWTYIGKVVLGTAIFTFLVFGIVFLVRRKQNH